MIKKKIISKKLENNLHLNLMNYQVIIYKFISIYYYLIKYKIMIQNFFCH